MRKHMQTKPVKRQQQAEGSENERTRRQHCSWRETEVKPGERWRSMTEEGKHTFTWQVEAENEKRHAMMRELDMTVQAVGYRGGQHQSTLMQVNKHRHIWDSSSGWTTAGLTSHLQPEETPESAGGHHERPPQKTEQRSRLNSPERCSTLTSLYAGF